MVVQVQKETVTKKKKNGKKKLLPEMVPNTSEVSTKHKMEGNEANNQPNVREEHSYANAKQPMQTTDAIAVPKKRPVTFRGLGLCEEVQSACTAVGWSQPTSIQQEAIPAILSGRDVVGVAQTGSGKTGVYVLPLIHVLYTNGLKFTYGLVLVPSRELAVQVMEECVALGKRLGVTSAVVLGGVSMVEQAEELSRRPRILVATPGRLAAHLEQTRGFHLRKIHMLVLDEADRMLDMDYEKEINLILEALPRQRQNVLLSATLTSKVDRLHRATLKDPHVIKISHAEFTTVEGLTQKYIFAPFAHRVGYLHQFLTHEVMSNSRVIIFCSSMHVVAKLTYTLRVLGLEAAALMGKMTQQARLEALERFRSAHTQILVCTDVAQRGIDIPEVDVVINYHLPNTPTDYIHRVGRTARIGRSGLAVTFVTQFDIPSFLKLEEALGKKMVEIDLSKEAVLENADRIQIAEREATQRIREEAFMGSQRGTKNREEEEEEVGGIRDAPGDEDEYKRAQSHYRLHRKREENMAMETGASRKKQRTILHEIRSSGEVDAALKKEPKLRHLKKK